MIQVDEKYKPNVFLNCDVPNMTYYVMSEFNKLPLVNTDSRVYGGMVSNLAYSQTSKDRLNKYLNGEDIRFVTITTKEGIHNEYNECLKNLKSKNFTILDEVLVRDFMGFSGHKLVFIFGE